jgi:hypothetical protein
LYYSQKTRQGKLKKPKRFKFKNGRRRYQGQTGKIGFLKKYCGFNGFQLFEKSKEKND